MPEGTAVQSEDVGILRGERDRLRRIVESQQRDNEKLRDGKKLPLPPSERRAFQKRLDYLILHEKLSVRNAFAVAEHNLPPETHDVLKKLKEDVERSFQWVRDNGTGFIEIALCGGTLYLFSDKEAGNGR